MKNRISTLILAFVCLFLTPMTYGQKIAIIDINDVLSNMPEYKAAQTELDQISATWRQEIAVEFDKVKSLYNKFQAEQVLLSADEKAIKENDIVKKEAEVREMQKRKFGPEGELFTKRQEMVAPIQDKVFATIESYAAEKGLDLIFDKSGSTGLLFSNPEFDKTGDIKKKLGIK
ncbi:MAG: OmpH family outer membrane protein [Saprospiraceae bacterium]|nr:OmpH family outer membrane protein [Saprospiraceae bacterium]